MGHYAELDNENNVVNVIYVGNELFPDDEGESLLLESTGKTYKRTSINTIENKHYAGGVPFRKNYARVGESVYDEERDAFYIKNSPYPSWVFNEDTCMWDAPVPNPMKTYPTNQWNEETQSWETV